MKKRLIVLITTLCLLFIAALPAMQASAGDWWDDDYWWDDDWYYDDPTASPDDTASTSSWPVSGHVQNFRTTESEIFSDSEFMSELKVVFDLNSLPLGTDEKNSLWGIFITNETDTDSYYNYQNYPCKTFKAGDLKQSNNVVTLKFDIGGSSETTKLNRVLYSGEPEEYDLTVCICEAEYVSSFGCYLPASSPVIKTKVKASSQDKWSASANISDIKLNKQSFSLGSVQQIKVSFKCSKTPVTANAPDLVFSIVGDNGNTVVEKTVNSSELKVGANEIDLSTRFSERGSYELIITQITYDSYSSYTYEWLTTTTTVATLDIAVKKAADSDGNAVDLRDSVSTQYSVYSKDQAKNLKISYTVSDASSKYHLFVVPRHSILYDFDKKKILPNCDFLSALDEMPIELGKTCTVTAKTKFDDFGMYTVVLYNISTKTRVAQSCFYVVPENYLIQRDVTGMNDQGIVPFSCDAEVYNINLDSDETISFNVAFPINYGNYYKEFQNKLGTPYNFFSDTQYASNNPYGGSYDEYSGYDEYDPDDPYGINYEYEMLDRTGTSNNEFKSDDAFFTDDYYVNMYVTYVPAGSKESRTLLSKQIKGIYKIHNIDFTVKELTEAIYSSSAADTSFAGVVTVTFTNESYEWKDYQEIYNNAIIKFTESFSFSVYKKPKIKSAKASAKSFDRAYGENAIITVTDNLGGKLYADIYKGKKKIVTVIADCFLSKNGTATGTIFWDLQASKGKYVDTGKYKAKLYTVTEYTEIDKNGKQSKKTVKSAKKSVSFKLVKPSGKLTLSTTVAGSSGDGNVYIESPQIGVTADYSIGSKVSIAIKNSSGKTIDSASFERGKGKWTCWMTLPSGLSAGTYKAEVTAKTLDGTTKTSTASFAVKKLPKPSISNASASADINTGLASVSFDVSQYSTVTVTVKSGSTTKQTVLNQSYSAGKVKTSFAIGDYAVGKYDVVITASNSGGSSTVTKTIEVKKKPVVVNKPTASNLSIRILTDKNGESYKGSFNYTGKNAKVIIDIMWNDTEEIVYTYEGTTKAESGTFTYTWDGYKSNGFRARAGSYTMRVHLVNSAGKTSYLRMNFVIGEG